MEKAKSELYEIAKRIIGNTIKKVVKNNPQLLEKGDREELEIQTEALLIKQLTAKVNISSNFSDQTEKTIEYVMQVFNRVFEEEYKQYIPERQVKKQEETDEHISAKKEQEDLEI